MWLLMCLPNTEILVDGKVTYVKRNIFDNSQWFLSAAICECDVVMGRNKIVELQRVLEVGCHEIDSCAAVNKDLCNGVSVDGSVDERCSLGCRSNRYRWSWLLLKLWAVLKEYVGWNAEFKFT